VARLHQAGIAHGDLGRHSVVVDDDGRPWLVDFDHATAVAPERLRQADLVELLVSLAVRFGPDRAVAGAVDAFGPSPWPPPWPPPAPSALTHTTREELGDAPRPLGRAGPPGRRPGRAGRRRPDARSGVDLLALPDDDHAALGDHEPLPVPSRSTPIWRPRGRPRSCR
jgi:hypothetical protein